MNPKGTDEIFSKVYNENNLKTLKRLDENSVDGIITSPPYNICTKRSDKYYDIGYQDNLKEEDYLEKRIKEFSYFSKILQESGVICYNISYHHQNPILPTKLIYLVDKKTDFTLADKITWKKNTSIPFQTSPTKLSRLCEDIYVIVKEKNLSTFTTNKNVSKQNRNTGQKFFENYTNYIEAPNNDGIETDLKAVYSVELVRKLINIYFPENSVIYDPFMGIGTTGVACKKYKRSFVGSEINEEFYRKAKERLESTKVQKNKFW